MTEIIRFEDDNHMEAWALIRMDDGDPCWVGIDKSGLRVKKSRIGLFGIRLYEERNFFKVARMKQTLSLKYPEDLTPGEMWNPNLKPVVNAILHCDSLKEARTVLNQADEKAELDRSLIAESEVFNRKLEITIGEPGL